MNINAVRVSLLLLIGLAVSASIAAEDRLKIEGIAGGDSVVVMMDASKKPGECSNDLVRRAGSNIGVGNVRRSSAACVAEVAIFSENNAMLLETPMNTWTNGPADVHLVKLQPVIDVPVSVWIADGGGTARPTGHMKRTEEVYRKNKVGIHFVFTVRDVSADATAVSIIDGGIGLPRGSNNPECRNIEKLQESAFYTPNTLNVYYVALETTGRNCAFKLPPKDCQSVKKQPEADGNITYIGAKAHRGVLAHEFGHAFGLRPGPCGGHTNGRRGFDESNIMWVSENADMDHFSLGQVFRMNTHTDQWGGSMLIKNGLRPDPGRPCPPLDYQPYLSRTQDALAAPVRCVRASSVNPRGNRSGKPDSDLAEPVPQCTGSFGSARMSRSA